MNREARLLFLIPLALTGIGLVSLYSASAIYASKRFGHDHFFFLSRQFLWAAISIATFFAATRIDLAILKKYSRYLLAAALVLLVLVFLPGIGGEIKGAHRWVKIAGFSFQPSELAKIALTIFVAGYIASSTNIDDFKKGFMPCFVYIGIVTALVLLEPDVGTAAMIAIVSSAITFVGGAKLKHLVFVLSISILVAGSIIVLKYDHVINRVSSFINPQSDHLGVGYQARQSVIAMGSGGLLGEGLGNGIQKLFYLPEPHSDFLLAVIGEELGFLGVSAVVTLLVTFLFTSWKIIRRTTDKFSFLLALGLTFYIIIQAILSIAVVTGSIPTKGVPTPFISYGGSNLVCCWLSCALLVNISKQTGETTQAKGNI